MASDNMRVDVTSVGQEAFTAALSLFDHEKTIAYRVEGMKIVLYWVMPENGHTVSKLPYAMTKEQIAEFTYGWLQSVEYPEQPDHDGSNSKGWRIYNEDWGHVDDRWEAYAAIKPVWAMHGK